MEKSKGNVNHLEAIMRQTEEIKHALPQDSIGDVIDQINAQNKRLEDTNSIFRSELLPAINKEITANRTKVNLANEKLSRLIEILKAIAQEQANFRESLKNLRRKANVNISRNDDIRKALQQLKRGN